MLDDGTVDLAITASLPNDKALDFAQIARETFILVAATEWKKQYLTSPFNPQQLFDLPLVAYDEDLPLIRHYFAAVFQMQLNTQAIVTVADLRIVRSLVVLS